MTTQSKGKHTPGPWVITGPYGGDFFHYGIKHKSQFVDGGEHAEVRNLHTTKEAQATAKANAALIAAAPELLEACKLALLVIDEHSDAGQCCSENVNTIKQAIAKAEGR